MIHNFNNFVNESLGSSLNFSAHGWWGKEKNLSAEKSVRPKVLGAKPKQAGKKEGGWGGIPLFLCEIKLRPAPPPARILGGQNATEKYSFH